MTELNLTPTEYTEAKRLAHDALHAFNTQDGDALTLVISRALDARDRAGERGRSAAVKATWNALAHSAGCMSRGNVSRASETRVVFHAVLESAKREARSAS